MKNNWDKVSLALFIAVIICFMLPFAGIFVFSANGFDIAKGIENLDPNPLAIAAIAAAVLGAAMFSWKARASQALQIVAGLVGGALLIALKIAVDDAADGALQWLYGFYLAVAGFFAAAAVNAYAMFGENNLPAAVPANSFSYGIKCPGCNNENNPNNNWCEFCGSALKGNTPPPTPANNFSYDAAPVSAPVPDYPVTQPLTNTDMFGVAEGRTAPLAAEYIPPAAPGQLAFLRVQRVGRWELIPILKNEFIIGSSHASTDYQEHSGNLGHIHARIEKTARGYGVTKMGTENVVFVNDKNLADSSIHPLNPGDRIRLNDIEYIFDLT